YRFFFILLFSFQTLGVMSAMAFEGFEESVEEGGLKTISAQESGLLTSIDVQENQWVDKGQILGHFEQMKMKNPIMAPYSGYVTKIFINPPLETRPYPMRSLEPILVLKRAVEAEPNPFNPSTTPNPPKRRENADGESTTLHDWTQGGQNQQFANSLLLLDEDVFENDLEGVSADSPLPQNASVPLASESFCSSDLLHQNLLPIQVYENLRQDVKYEGPFRIIESGGRDLPLRSDGRIKNRAVEETSRAKDRGRSENPCELQKYYMKKTTLPPTEVFDELNASGFGVHKLLSKAWTCGTFATVDPFLKGLFFPIHLPSVHVVMWSWVLLFAVLLAQEELLLLKIARRFSNKRISRIGIVFHRVDGIQKSNFNRRIKREILRRA
ncbi:MAG: acetyl-CoA carboxylase biotin carboxyl carrier protein subunit, partial [Alphaproteobacteria bacterium]|nr:acetyl-CoA carboxylase biotin carboxyl carrier protein subunit [Alphaproteobacteria bacterium]